MTQRWLVFYLLGCQYGIPVHLVREITTTHNKHIRPLPLAPIHVSGVINLRRQVMPVVDLRVLLGMKSMDRETKEIIQLLHDRQQDHVNWLKELQACVDEKREFKLATDPHKCKFGKWYDSLMSNVSALNNLSNGDSTLIRIMKEFDAPHQQIHGVAAKVLRLAEEKRIEESHRLLDDTRDTKLTSMIQLFDKTTQLISEMRRSILVEIEHGSSHIGILVDAVDNVIEVDDASIDTSHTIQESPYVHGFLVGETKNQRIATLMNLESLIRSVS